MTYVDRVELFRLNKKTLICEQSTEEINSICCYIVIKELVTVCLFFYAQVWNTLAAACSIPFQVETQSC